jgi:hypothetical protein
MKKRLKELFKYENGLLIRIVKTSNNTKVGDVVGTSTDTAGYARVKIDGANQMVHRMIWIYHNGAIEDKYIIDHKDRNKNNNNYTNLEWCTQRSNLQHSLDTNLRINAIKSKQKNNKSGYIGVRKQDNVYAVQIRYKGKTIHTKYGFKTAYDGAVHRDKYLDYNNLPHTRSL